MSTTPTAAIIGKGTSIGYASAAAGPFTAMAEVNDAPPPGEQVGKAKATHYASPDGRHEYVPGWIDPQTIKVKCNYTKSQEATMRGDLGVSQYFQVTLPDASTYVFPGWIENLGTAVPNENVISSEITIHCNGKVVFTAGA